MSMDLKPKDFSTAPEYFVAGLCHIEKTVKAAKENIPAHAPVVLNADGKLEVLTAPGSGETLDLTGLYGITPDSIKKDEEGPVWLTGEYFKDAVVLPEGITVDDVAVALRNIGIFLK